MFDRLEDFFRNFFQIREKISGTLSAVLGVLPIIVVLVVWFIATWGRTETITLPDGTLDTGATEIVVGRHIDDGTRLRIPGATLKNDPESGDTCVLLNGERFPVPFGRPIESDGGVSVKLPTGKILLRGARGGTPSTDTGLAAPSGDVSQNTLPLGPSDAKTISPPGSSGDGSTAAQTSGSSQQPVQTSISRGGVIPQKSMALIVFSYERLDTRLFSASILPSPGDVVRSLPGLWYERALAKNVFISFKRVIEGFLVAFLVTFPLGILMGTFSKIRSMFSPLMVFSGYMPIPTLVPLSITFFGLSESQKVMFLALAFAIYLLPAVVRAVEEIDNVYLQTAYTLGASRFQTMTRVLLGIAAPNIYDAMRMSFGVGWGYIILAEMVDMGCGGVGASIIVSQRRGLAADVYLILVVIVIIAFITDKLWEFFGDWLFPYRRLKR